MAGAPDILQTLADRFDPEAFDAPGGRAVLRLRVQGEGDWDATVTGGRMTLAPPHGPPPHARLAPPPPTPPAPTRAGPPTRRPGGGWPRTCAAAWTPSAAAACRCATTSTSPWA